MNTKHKKANDCIHTDQAVQRERLAFVCFCGFTGKRIQSTEHTGTLTLVSIMTFVQYVGIHLHVQMNIKHRWK